MILTRSDSYSEKPGACASLQRIRRSLKKAASKGEFVRPAGSSWSSEPGSSGYRTRRWSIPLSAPMTCLCSTVWPTDSLRRPPGKSCLRPSMDDEAGRKKYGWMWDSSTFQAILEEGRVEGEVRGQIREARQIVIELGTSEFWPLDTPTVATIERLDDLDSLRGLLRGVLKASAWQEVLATASDRWDLSLRPARVSSTA